MANDLTRKIMANIAAKSIVPRTVGGSSCSLSANEEASLTGVIYGGHKQTAPAAKGARPGGAARASGGAISLAALAQQKRHG